MKKILALAVVISLGGCTSLAQFAASTATNLSSSNPSQVTTLAEADLAADTLVKVTKVAVDTGKLDSGTLHELQALRGGVRTALEALHTANAAGQNVNYAAFNAALDAYNAYTTLKGINH